MICAFNREGFMNQDELYSMPIITTNIVSSAARNFQVVISSTLTDDHTLIDNDIWMKSWSHQHRFTAGGTSTAWAVYFANMGDHIKEILTIT